MQRCLLLLLALLGGGGLLPTTEAQVAAWHDSATVLEALSPGSAQVATGLQLLQAFADGVGSIELLDDITLTPADWQTFDLPIVVDTNGSAVLVHSADPNKQMVLDWNFVLEVLNVQAGSTLAFDNIVSKNPGNRTKAIENNQVPYEVVSAILWPTVSGMPGHFAYYSNSFAYMDTPDCNPNFVQIEIERLHQMLKRNDTVEYLGGVNVHYTNITYPSPITDLTTRQQVGVAFFTFHNVTTTCYDSAQQLRAAGDSGGGGGGTPGWVWAVVGTVGGLLAIAVAAGAVYLRRHGRRQQAQHAASLDDDKDKASSLCELGSGPASLASGALSGSLDPHAAAPLCSGSHETRLASGHSGHSGEMASTWMRTRFGAIDGVQLGELLGRGAFGRVYRGRWMNAVVAVKIVEHSVQPGQTHDLSREPLLSMSVSHPNVVITHKMAIVKVSSGADAAAAAAAAQQQQRPADGRASGSGGSRKGSGQLVPALDGSGGMVEVVSPSDVLQPGLYETWLVLEYCDRGSLADLIADSKLGGDAAQHEVWALLCLLDIAQGLDYLHKSGIVHGDLKPQNILLKSARNDRRGFVCKVGDFGLSRILGAEQTHLETANFGTASYAAPELLSGKLSSASDVYSFGMIIWGLASGGEPYPGWNAMQIIVQVSQQGHRPDVPADCPPFLAALLQRCWSQDPQQRPTAAAIVKELRGELQQQLRPAAPKPAD